MGESDIAVDEMVDEETEEFINSSKNIWTEYINDPMWSTNENRRYYKQLSLEEELKNIKQNTPCSQYNFYDFKITEISTLIQKYFNIDNPVMEIQFDT